MTYPGVRPQVQKPPPPRPKPCENAFRRCGPSDLAGWIESGELDHADLSLALEILGEHGPRHAAVIAKHFSSDSAVVREGALYGLFEVISHMAEHDTSAAIRRVAGDILL